MSGSPGEPIRAGFPGHRSVHDDGAAARLRGTVSPTVLATPDGLILAANEPFCALVGLPAEQLLHSDLFGLIAESHHSVFSRSLESAQFGPVNTHLWLRVPGGVAFPAALGIVSHMENGRNCRRITISEAHDTTASSRALEKNAAYLRILFEQSRDGNLLMDRTGKVIEANQSFANMLGYTLPELRKISVADWDARWTPTELAHRLESFEASSGTFETRHRRKDGREIDVEIACNPVNLNGTFAIQCVIRDISERKAAERALRESEARERARATEIEAILNAVPVGVIVAHDVECRNLTANSAACQLLGLPPGVDLASSIPVGPKILKDGVELPFDQWPVVRATSGVTLTQYAADLLRHDGSVAHLLGNAVPLLDEAGKPRGAVGAFLDVTETRRMEQNLFLARKGESIGLLAGGIAHDFNNLLTVIQGHAELLLRKVPPECEAGLESIRHAAELAAGLTGQLLTYAGKAPVRAELLNISDCSVAIERTLRGSLSPNIRFVVTPGPNLPFAEFDRSQFEQVVIGLVSNAGEAIGEEAAGVVTLQTSARVVTEHSLQDSVSADFLPAGLYVELCVSDSGCGMDAATQARIFDPFFTTKFPGRGLGLAAVAGICRTRHGGIVVESTPGKGSTFRVLLPAAPQAPAATAEHVPARSEGGSDPDATPKNLATVLVVDDEPMIRDLCFELLSAGGYRVVTAEDGASALGILSAVPDAIDLVLIDMALPAMGAGTAIAELRAVCPRLPIVLMSGSETALRGRRVRDLHLPSVLKPFDHDSLLRTIRAALEGRA